MMNPKNIKKNVANENNKRIQDYNKDKFLYQRKKITVENDRNENENNKFDEMQKKLADLEAQNKKLLELLSQKKSKDNIDENSDNSDHNEDENSPLKKNPKRKLENCVIENNSDEESDTTHSPVNNRYHNFLDLLNESTDVSEHGLSQEHDPLPPTSTDRTQRISPTRTPPFYTDMTSTFKSTDRTPRMSPPRTPPILQNMSPTLSSPDRTPRFSRTPSLSPEMTSTNTKNNTPQPKAARKSPLLKKRIPPFTICNTPHDSRIRTSQNSTIHTPHNSQIHTTHSQIRLSQRSPIYTPNRTPPHSSNNTPNRTPPPHSSNYTPNLSQKTTPPPSPDLPLVKEFKPILYETYKKLIEENKVTVEHLDNEPKLYEIVEDKVYLGHDVKVGQGTWAHINKKKKEKFCREVARCLWSDRKLANRCLDYKKVKNVIQGRSPMKMCSPKKLNTYLQLYKDYLEEKKFDTKTKELLIPKATETLSIQIRDIRRIEMKK